MAPSAPSQSNAHARSRALVGMESPRVTVETHLPGGLPGFTLVGLPETAVREARDRVKSAIQNCGFDYPRGRIVVNLAPAELAKEGARFDLAIAVSILRATRQLPPRATEDFEYIGELGLYGELRATRGCLCAALALQREEPTGATRLVMPGVNAADAHLGPAGRLLVADHLSSLAAFLRNPQRHPLPLPPAPVMDGAPADADLNDVIGQQAAKRALIIAAAGGHHLLMVGPPGTGKTMLARRLGALLPSLPDGHAMEVAAVHSAAAIPPPPAGRPPLRNPHHSASAPAMVGGGRHAVPGEISLAHRGVLFLDELPHFRPSVLDLLREPLESGHINIARAGYRTLFPAAFQLVAAMNPCPAGQNCSEGSCRCAPEHVRRYQGRVSGPLLDRIDLHVTVPPVPPELVLAAAGPAAADIAEPRRRVAAARALQAQRQGCLNAHLAGPQTLAAAGLDNDARRLLQRAAEGFGLSARGTHRVLRAARTIADLEGSTAVSAAALAEALSYRSLDWSASPGMAAG